MSPEQSRTRKTRSRPKMSLRGIVLSLFGLGVYLLEQNLEAIARRNPISWHIYEHMAHHMGHHTYLGLFYTSFLGALFFVFIPLEAVFYYYLALPRWPGGVLLGAWLGSVLGLFADYLIGALVGQKLVARFWPEQFLKTKRGMERWGALIVVVSNLVPFLPVQFISLAIGATRFGARRFVLYTAVSRLAYLALLLAGGLWFQDTLGPLFR